MVQPSPLKSKAPQLNKAVILKSGRCPGIDANVIDLQKNVKEFHAKATHFQTNSKTKKKKSYHI